MINVESLTPGDRVHLAGMSAVFVVRTQHPLWPHLALVVWRLDTGEWSHDALDFRQDVGEPEPATPELRVANLRAALLHRSQL